MDATLAKTVFILLATFAVSPADDVLSVRTNPDHVNAGVIAEVQPNGTVLITDLSNPRLWCDEKESAESDLSEGHFLAFLGRDTDFAFGAFELPPAKTWVSPIDIVSVDRKNQATARFPAAAMERVRIGQKVAIFRPPGTTTAVVRAMPVADLEEPSERVRAISKLLTIGQALRYWRETFGGFPPAVVRGPDGSPWHSWRVLLLPFLDRGDLFNRYHFDEPWNGPNNKKLLKEIPDCYQFSSDQGFPSTATHFVSIVGEKTAFKPQGLTNHDPGTWMIGDYKPGVHGIKLEDIIDGASSTVLIGSANPQNPVDWLKPDDVAFSKEMGPPGNVGSFGAPITFQHSEVGVFLWADGSVSTIASSIKPSVFRALFTVNGGEDPIDSSNRPAAVSPSMGSIGIIASSTIQFVKIKGRSIARITFRR